MSSVHPFRLQPVLTYKKNREDVIETELAQLRQACRQEEQGLALLQAKEEETLDSLGCWQREGESLDAAAVDMQFTYLSWIGERVRYHAQRVEEARRHVEQRRQDLVVAAKEKKVLEKLKERQETDALCAEQHAENRRVDEISIVQFHQRRLGLSG